jgi:MraZ protein
MGFTGTHYHFMDNKGRVNIPSRYRELLQEGKDQPIYLTNFQQKFQGNDQGPRYLLAFPFSEWKTIEAKFGGQNPFSQQMRLFQRYIVSRAEECPLDRQGRILVPTNLREYANFSREVCIVGATNSFEIWDRATFEAHSKQMEDFFDEGALDELFKPQT